jgi:hypothetical protein
MEIQGYPNYLIYPDGRVSSSRFPDRFLKPLRTRNKNPYYNYRLYHNKKYKHFQIHRLVALHYIPNPDNKPQVDHINRDTSDNRVENLRWVTISENQHNTKIRITNTSGHRNIRKRENRKYRFTKLINEKQYDKSFKTLKEALCYKYIFTLKMRAGLV